MRSLMGRLLLVLGLLWACLGLGIGLGLAAEGQGAAPTPTPAPPAPAKVDELLGLLADPAVQAWLVQQRRVAPSAPAAESDAESMAASLVGARIAAIREHIHALAAALPSLPDEMERAWIILSLEFEEHGLIEILLPLLGFAALGFGSEAVFWRATRTVRDWILNFPLEAVGDRLRGVGMRLGFSLCLIAVFALGSVGAFLALPWPPLLREIVLGFLLAFLAVRLATVVGRFLLAPGTRRYRNAERFRIVPMSTPRARFWQWRIELAVAWFSFGGVSVDLLRTLGVAVEARRLIAYALGLGLLGLGLEIVWRRPQEADGNPPSSSQLGERTWRWLVSAYLVGLWFLWVAGVMAAFWLAVIVVGLPAVIAVAQRSVNHLLRPPGAADAATGPPSVIAVSLERGVRTVLIIVAALGLAHAWHVDLTELTASDTLFTRAVRGALSAVVIVLVADFVWRLTRALIDRKLAETEGGGEPDSEEAQRRARLRTLLPILRNVLFVVVTLIAAMMALSAMGVEIGPLIAGAGVVGVAIGFGAQTLVRDIFSGIFYLLDDAFRVGEYIQSGTYKGTVESFSLRSIKLRHHRGPLYTVPFGVLGAIQNMSRDWVIDKLTISVTYDTDLDKAKKLIKAIGKELTQDPECAPFIIETLKMQGVEQFGDYAIKIRLKMMTKPGEQFVIRRKAYALIKKAFDANGIKFAFPTVQVSGGGAAEAAAQQMLDAARPAPEPS